MAYSSVLQMYLGWANSLLCERGVLVNCVEQLQDGRIFILLVDVLTNEELQFEDSNDEQEGSLNRIQAILDFMNDQGITLGCRPQDVVRGDMKSILDVLWVLILHFTIHSIDVPSVERTVRNGRMVLLQWCSQQLDAKTIDMKKNLIDNFKENNNLAYLIEDYTSLTIDAGQQDAAVSRLSNAMIAAEETLGILKSLLSPADVLNGSTNEYALLIYLALLKRKVTVLIPNLSVMSTPTSDDEGQRSSFTDKLSNSNSRMEESMNFSSEIIPGFTGPLADRSQTYHQNRDTTQNNLSVNNSTDQSEGINIELSQSESGVDNQSSHRITSGITSEVQPQSGVVGEGTLGVRREEPFGAEKESFENSLRETLQNMCVEVPNGKERVSTQRLEDELLGLLDTIGSEGKQLRNELDQAQEREVYLLEQLQDQVTEKYEQQVIARLVQELEMLRNENKRLFRELADARNDATQSKKREHSLTSKLTQVEIEMEKLKMENFSLKIELESRRKSREERDSASEMSYSELAEDEKEVARNRVYSPDSQTSKKLRSLLQKSYIESKSLRSQLSELGAEACEKATEFANDLHNLRESNLNLSEENKSLKRTAENGKLDLEVAQNKISRLEKYLNTMREQNAKLVSHLSDSTDGMVGNIQPKFAVNVQVLKDENVELKVKLKHAEEDRKLLRRELEQLREVRLYAADVKKNWEESFERLINGYTECDQDLGRSPQKMDLGEDQRQEKGFDFHSYPLKHVITGNGISDIHQSESDRNLNRNNRENRHFSSKVEEQSYTTSQVSLDAASVVSSTAESVPDSNFISLPSLPNFKKLPFRPQLSESEITQSESETFTDDEQKERHAPSGITSSQVFDLESHWRSPSLGDLIVQRSQVRGEIQNRDPDSGMASTMQSTLNVDDSDAFITADEETIVHQMNGEDVTYTKTPVRGQELNHTPYHTPVTRFSSSPSVTSRGKDKSYSGRLDKYAENGVPSSVQLNHIASPYTAYCKYLSSSSPSQPFVLKSNSILGSSVSGSSKEIASKTKTSPSFGGSSKANRIPKWRQLRYSQASSPTKGSLHNHSIFNNNNTFSPNASARKSFPKRNREDQNRTVKSGLVQGVLTENAVVENEDLNRNFIRKCWDVPRIPQSSVLSPKHEVPEKEITQIDDDYKKLPDQLIEPQKLAEVTPPKSKRSPNHLRAISPSLRIRLQFEGEKCETSTASSPGKGGADTRGINGTASRSHSSDSPVSNSSVRDNGSYSQYDDGTNPDVIVERIIRQADSGISLASIGYDGATGVEREDKYVHRMLSESEQVYANSIIEKYLTQTSS